jgi:hypothetical protein
MRKWWGNHQAPGDMPRIVDMDAHLCFLWTPRRMNAFFVGLTASLGARLATGEFACAGPTIPNRETEHCAGIDAAIAALRSIELLSRTVPMSRENVGAGRLTRAGSMPPGWSSSMKPGSTRIWPLCGAGDRKVSGFGRTRLMAAGKP